MARYKVALQDWHGESESDETGDRQEALDWFMAGAEDVLNAGRKTVRCALEVDGKVWGLVREPEE